MNKINETSQGLLILTAEELINLLKKDSDATSIKMLAFLAYLKDSEEEIQIQVTVTRSKHDFIEPFDTVYFYED